MTGKPRARRKIGRVETGLNADLQTRNDIPKAERAALRAQARAVDTAEVAHDVDQVTRANAVYLQLRSAAGLTGGGSQPVDTFAELLAELSRPAPGGSDLPNT